jgi:hypothetical protein
MVSAFASNILRDADEHGGTRIEKSVSHRKQYRIYERDDYFDFAGVLARM